MYIVLEGMVGSGKSTNTQLLAARLREVYPDREVITVREPGGTEIAQAIRTLVQGTKFGETMHPITEVYLYGASRAQLLHTVVKPALERGAIVLSDRNFLSSFTCQGSAQGLDPMDVMHTNELAVSGVLPDIVFHLDIDVDTALARTGDPDDKFEQYGRPFFEAVSASYADAAALPMFAGRWSTIDANRSTQDIQRDIYSVLHTQTELKGL